MIVVALLLGGLSGGFSGGSSDSSKAAGPLPAVSASAPPNANAQLANCTKVLEKLPVSLGKLDPRAVHTTPDSPLVVAWGEPAVVFRCGVAKPKALYPGSSVQFQSGGVQDGPYYDVTRRGDANVWTTVDRAPYISVTIPSKYQGGDVIPLITRPIAAALPAVCSTDSGVADPAELCTRRRT